MRTATDTTLITDGLLFLGRPNEAVRLTRRDALAALSAVAAGGAGCLDSGSALGDHERATLVAVAEVIYPSEVDGVASFVRDYAVGRAEDDPDHREGVEEAVTALDRQAEAFHDAPFSEAADPDGVLRGMGVDGADPDPDGERRERVRYYLVNDLLYALYASPTGGELAGIENPQGHPGGVASYRHLP
jgi:hypothetical protein